MYLTFFLIILKDPSVKRLWNFKDIALFVAQRLAVLDGVLSTATHFVLSRYKDWGVVLGEEGIDERRIISI